MKPLRKYIENMSMDQIEKSGQCFRIKNMGGNRYSVITGEYYLEVEDFKDGSFDFYCTEEEFQSVWKEYFDLDTDYGQIIKDIDAADEYLTAAGVAGSGIRILKQDLWEMVVTFIISQRMSIPRIASIVESLCEGLGTRCEVNGKVFYAFPTPEQMADKDLSGFSLGYRDKYLSRLAREVAYGEFSLEYLNEDHELKEYLDYLCSIYGVGVKVANCVVLFGMHKLDAFPIDTWISRIVDREYAGRFPVEKYKYAGVLQQYIFYYERLLNGR